MTLSKFGDHTPLYRLEDIFLRTGFKIGRSTLCGWLIAMAELARPLVMRMKHLLLQSQVIHTDDTSIKMLQPGAGVAQEVKFARTSVIGCILMWFMTSPLIANVTDF